MLSHRAWQEKLDGDRRAIRTIQLDDPRTHAIVVALLAAIAVLASYLPARRAARIEPLTALRPE